MHAASSGNSVNLVGYHASSGAFGVKIYLNIA